MAEAAHFLDRLSRVALVANADGEEEPAHIAGLIADRRRPGSLLVRTAACVVFDEPEPGRLLTTRDGGRTWAVVPAPAVVEADAEGAEPSIVEAAVRGGDLSRLAARVQGEGWWVTKDGGGTWARAEGGSNVRDLPGEGWQSDRAAEAPVGGGGACKVRATPDGLMKVCGRRAAERIFPTATTRQWTVSLLRQAAGKVKEARIVALGGGHTVARLSPAQVRRLNRALARGERSEGWAATSPFTTPLVLAVGSARLTVHYVAGNLRLNVLEPAQGGANATDPMWRANAVDLTLTEEDAEWLEGLLGAHGGGPTSREHMSIEQYRRKPLELPK